jgi:threonine aldolase
MPTAEMLQAIATAKLGDDSRDGDPTVLELEALAADMFAKEAAMLTVSGTMSNLVALRTHTQPGATAIVEQAAHVYRSEYGHIAAACGLLVSPVPGRLGVIEPDALRLAVRAAAVGFPARGILCLENTHNTAGGTVLTPQQTDLYAEIAREAGLAVHLDGARIFNAAVALGVGVQELARSVDSVCVCLSKGLSAPLGSLLMGNREFIGRARRVRRALGGNLRQAGIIAGPGLVALRTMVDRLAEDHANARLLAQQIATVDGLHVDMEAVQSNMVYADVAALGIDAVTFGEHLRQRGVRGLPGLTTRIRFVTYRGVTPNDVERAAAIIRDTVVAAPWKT